MSFLKPSVCTHVESARVNCPVAAETTTQPKFNEKASISGYSCFYLIRISKSRGLCRCLRFAATGQFNSAWHFGWVRRGYFF